MRREEVPALEIDSSERMNVAISRRHGLYTSHAERRPVKIRPCIDIPKVTDHMDRQGTGVRGGVVEVCGSGAIGI